MLTMLTTTELEKQENKVLGKALANIQQLFRSHTTNNAQCYDTS